MKKYSAARTEKSMGQIGYEAYCTKTDWKSLVSGQPLPQWIYLKPEIQYAWDVAAAAIIKKQLTVRIR